MFLPIVLVFDNFTVPTTLYPESKNRLYIIPFIEGILLSNSFLERIDATSSHLFNSYKCNSKMSVSSLILKCGTSDAGICSPFLILLKMFFDMYNQYPKLGSEKAASKAPDGSSFDLL